MASRQPKREACSSDEKALTTEQIAELRHRREQGGLIKNLMTDYRLSKASVYRYLGETDSFLSTESV